MVIVELPALASLEKVRLCPLFVDPSAMTALAAVDWSLKRMVPLVLLAVASIIGRSG